jgi:hypothetical protein
VRELILRLARQNSHWGCVRIVGRAPQARDRGFATLVPGLACDFFTVDTVWLRRL